jgi:hypothetical protein
LIPKEAYVVTYKNLTVVNSYMEKQKVRISFMVHPQYLQRKRGKTADKGPTSAFPENSKIRFASGILLIYSYELLFG